MRSGRGILVSTLMVALMPLAASAATVSYTDTYGPTAVPFPSSVGASLPKFDPGFGTLTKVTLELDANVSNGTIAWDNEAAVTTDITLGIGAEVTADVAGLLTAVAIPLQTDSATGIDADNDGAADFLGSDSFTVVGGSGNDNDMDMSTLASTLTFFTGAAATFDVTMEAAVETFLSTSGGFGPIDPVPGATEGTVKVTYEYTAVPEPGSMLLLGMGAFAALRRRR